MACPPCAFIKKIHSIYIISTYLSRTFWTTLTTLLKKLSLLQRNIFSVNLPISMTTHFKSRVDSQKKEAKGFTLIKSSFIFLLDPSLLIGIFPSSALKNDQIVKKVYNLKKREFFNCIIQVRSSTSNYCWES